MLGARPSLAMLLLVAATHHHLMATAQWTAPSFYRGMEGPRYTVLKSLGDGVELRRYEPGSWVSVKTAAADKDTAMRGSFMQLFSYISGGNAAGAKIAMTAPVLTKIEPGQGPTCDSTFTISFYNPYVYQGASPPPAPTSKGVFTNKLGPLEVWVLPYGGFSSAASDQAKATELMKRLDAAKEPYSTDFWLTAGYDSPYTLTNRRNEVWLPHATAAAAAGGATPAKAAAAAAAASTPTAAEAGKTNKGGADAKQAASGR